MVMKINIKENYLVDDWGMTLVELLVSITIGTMLFAPILGMLFDSTRISADNSTIQVTERQVQVLSNVLVSELRNIGSGMPLGQTTFNYAVVGDVALSVIPSSNTTNLTFRVNPYGTSTVTTVDYTPGPKSLVIQVFDSTGFAVGQTVYLSNMLSGGTTALSASIEKISGNLLTIKSDYITTSGAIFPSGSSLTRVATVHYNGANASGIARDEGAGEIVITPNASLTFDYLDESGKSLSLPLSANDIQTNLSSISFTVTLDADRKLKDGSIWTAEAIRKVALRNLIAERN